MTRGFLLVLSLFLCSEALSQSGEFSLPTRPAVPGATDVEIPIQLVHDVPEGVAGFSFGLDHEEAVLDLAGLVYLGPVIDPEFLAIDALPGAPFATLGVLFSLTWLLAADLLDEAPRERIARSYGVVGAASILGGVLGGLIARAVSHSRSPPPARPAQ